MARPTLNPYTAQMGTLLRRARLSAGLSQQRLADAAGFESGASIYKIEVGDTSVSIEALCRIAAALDRPITDLIPPPPGHVRTVRERLARAANRLDNDALAAVLVLVEKMAGPEPAPEPGRQRSKRTRPAA